MSPQPPRLARRLLARILAGDPAGAAILGDLQEDFVAVARNRGPAAARRWYWREAVGLGLGRGRERVVAAISGTRSSAGRGPSAPPQKDRLLPELLQDAGYAMRSLRGSPGFALFTAAVIGLGVGAATSVFGVLEPLVLAPLPFEEPEELVWIANEADPGDNSLSAVTSRTANLHDFRERSRSFDGLTGYNAFFDDRAYTLTGVGEPERLVGAGVAHDFLDVLGVEPLHGRSFTAEEGRPGGPPAVILSHGLWRRRFAAAPGIVGRTLVLEAAGMEGRDPARTVVGVLPPTFDFSSAFSPGVQVDFLLPFPVIAAGDPGFQGNTLAIIGRLRPGVTPAAAQAELDAILAALREDQPERWGLGAELTPLQAHLAGPFRPALLLLAAAAGTLLLIVCVNVSNMILARSPGRARELAIRKALGASRGRLVRQLVLETLGIALAGAALGSGIAWAVTRFVADTAGRRIPLMDEIVVDGSVLLFAAAVAVLTGLLVGLVPALRVSEGGEASVLREGGHASSATRGARRLRESLVVAEVTLACVLLVVGGLLVRSFRAVLDVNLGFDPANTVAWQLDPGLDLLEGAEANAVEWQREKGDFYAALTDRVAAAPGIDDVGLIDALPLGRNRTWPYSVVGRPEEGDAEGRRSPTTPREQAFPHIVDPGYLSAMRISLVEGRNISRHDGWETGRVVLLNESGARRIFGGKAALGRRLEFWGPWEWEVVGIVADVRHLSPEMDPGIQAYFPVAQMPMGFNTLDLVVRSRLSVPQIAAAVRAALHEMDPSMPTRDFWTVESTVDGALSSRRFTLVVLTAFGAAALLLAGLGIYGVLAHSVAERRQEIGIRMALGASAADVVRSVLGRTLLLAGVGATAGAVLSLWTTRLLDALLFGVSATDPGTFVGMVLLLLLVAAVAGTVPARRAVRTGASALREG